MEIVVDGGAANENPAAAYRGLGCISGSNSSRLLLDYKVEHPNAYKEIMRLLFEKGYGLGLSHLKIELGADVNSSSGTEPCVKRTPNEQADVTRGAGFQFAADARAINPDLTIDLLRWGEPGWVARAFTVSQQHGLEARYRWYKETLDAAYAVYGLQFDYISADQSETDAPDEAWILYLRYRLDNEQNTPYDYSKIKLIASDEVGTRNIASQMVDNADLRDSVDVIGLHYTTYGDSYTSLLNEAYGKEIWYSEGSAPCNIPELTSQADGSGLIGRNGAIDIANRIINSYYNGKMVLYEFQPAVASYYDGSRYAPKQLIRAWEPWSGHYVLDLGFWMALHFARFSEKGWMFIASACFGDGEEDHAISNTTSNYMTLCSPDRQNFSMFFTNDSKDMRIYAVSVKDMAIEPTYLNIVTTKGPGDRQPYNAGWFRRGRTIRIGRGRNKRYFTIKVPPYSIMTVTTLNTDWVGGTSTFSELAPPPAARLSLPYRDDLRYTEEEIRMRGCAPRYMTDQGGAFEVVETDEGFAVCQRITSQIIPSNWRFRNTPPPLTCFGDDRWRSYSMETQIKLSTSDPSNYAGIAIRYNSAVTNEYTSLCGYSGRLYGDGTWRLLDMESVAAEGLLTEIDPTSWNNLKLVVLGNSIFFFIGGNLLTRYTPQCIVNSGRAALCSGYARNLFRNISIEPIPVQPPYVRRIDCFDENVGYNPDWEIHAMESYRFYNRTSMEAQQGAEFSFRFEGTGIAILGTAQNIVLTVLIDGRTVYNELSVALSDARQAVCVIDSLPPGRHELKAYVKGGSFKLDAFEIPEESPDMPDTAIIPPALRAASSERLRRQNTIREEKADFMDAAAMLWHIAHPFEPAPAEPPEPVPTKPASEASTEDSTQETPTENTSAETADAPAESADNPAQTATVPPEEMGASIKDAPDFKDAAEDLAADFPETVEPEPKLAPTAEADQDAYAKELFAAFDEALASDEEQKEK